MKRRLNMMSLLDEAWIDKTARTESAYLDTLCNLISHGYWAMEGPLYELSEKEGAGRVYNLLGIIKRLFAGLVYADSAVSAIEQKAFGKLTQVLQDKSLDDSVLAELHAESREKTTEKDYHCIAYCRKCIPAPVYRAFALGMCYLTIGDGAFGVQEYAFLKGFFDPKTDYVPSWEVICAEYESRPYLQTRPHVQ